MTPEPDRPEVLLVSGAAAYILTYYDLVILAYFLFLNSTYVFLFVLSSARAVRHHKRPKRSPLPSSKKLPGITLLVPAYNEERIIAQTVASYLKLPYPGLKVMVINDGSEDSTLAVLDRAFGLAEIPMAKKNQLTTRTVTKVYASRNHPGLLVVDKVNGGKADALNAGLSFTQTELFMTADADSLLEPGALKELAAAYLKHPDELMGAGGIVLPGNDSLIKDGRVIRSRLPRGFLTGMQALEYLRTFLAARPGWSAVRGLMIESGTLSMFKLDKVLALGGYRAETVGEDMDLVLRLRRKLCKDGGCRFEFLPVIMCWTQAPESISTLGAQRDRWQRGLVESLVHNWGLMFAPSHHVLGMYAFPFYFFTEMLGPVVELSGYAVVAVSAILGFLSWQYLLLFLTAAFGLSLMLSLASVALDLFTIKAYSRAPDVARLAGLALAESFSYRYLTLWWRFRALFRVKRFQGFWGEVKRREFSKEET